MASSSTVTHQHSIHSVGEYLSQSIASRPLQSDSLARSAINRYYYSTFLRVRGTLSQIHARDIELGHSDYPKHLNGKVLKRLEHQLNSAYKNNIVSAREYGKLKSMLHSSVKFIADTMALGFDTRVIADYEPEIRVVFSGTAFSLEGVGDSDARNWLVEVSKRCAALESIWNACGSVPIKHQEATA